MSDRTPRWLVVGLLAVSPLAMSSSVLAQQAPPAPVPTPAAPAHSAPRPEDLEPGVNTSATTPTATNSDASAPADTTPPPAPKVGKPSASSTAASGGKPAATAASAPTTNSVVKGGKKAEDRLQLDTTDITGNQELPKVLYIVPWKRSDLGDLLGKPANSLLDEVLQPIDRDVFKRENRYYEALKPDAAGTADKGAGAASQGSGDKR